MVNPKPSSLYPKRASLCFAVLERHVSREEEQAQLAALHSNFHMAAVLDFFYTFRHAAGLAACEFEAEQLESAIILSPGGPGVLGDVHMVRQGLRAALRLACHE